MDGSSSDEPRPLAGDSGASDRPSMPGIYALSDDGNYTEVIPVMRRPCLCRPRSHRWRVMTKYAPMDECPRCGGALDEPEAVEEEEIVPGFELWGAAGRVIRWILRRQ